MTKWLKQIFCTKIGWIGITFILVNIFIYLELPNWLIALPFSYWIILFLIMMFYTIKNTINDIKND